MYFLFQGASALVKIRSVIIVEEGGHRYWGTSRRAGHVYLIQCLPYIRSFKQM